MNAEKQQPLRKTAVLGYRWTAMLPPAKFKGTMLKGTYFAQIAGGCIRLWKIVFFSRQRISTVPEDSWYNSFPHLCPTNDLPISFILWTMKYLHTCDRLHGFSINWACNTRKRGKQTAFSQRRFIHGQLEEQTDQMTKQIIYSFGKHCLHAFSPPLTIAASMQLDPSFKSLFVSHSSQFGQNSRAAVKQGFLKYANWDCT